MGLESTLECQECRRESDIDGYVDLYRRSNKFKHCDAVSMQCILVCDYFACDLSGNIINLLIKT